MATSNSYDYKPLLIQIFDSESKHMKNYLIDGTQFHACVELAKKNMKSLGGSYFEISCRKTDKLLHSSNELTSEQKEELQKIANEVQKEAELVVKDYAENPSKFSGEIDTDKNLVKGDGVVVHANSPILNEESDDKE